MKAEKLIFTSCEFHQNIPAIYRINKDGRSYLVCESCYQKISKNEKILESGTEIPTAEETEGTDKISSVVTPKNGGKFGWENWKDFGKNPQKIKRKEKKVNLNDDLFSLLLFLNLEPIGTITISNQTFNIIEWDNTRYIIEKNNTYLYGILGENNKITRMRSGNRIS